MSSFDRDIGSAVGNGRYRLLERIGEGSMGQVFRAYDRHLLTDVVIKFPTVGQSSLEGPAFLERFDREVRSLVHLSHPHIVKILDVGVQDDLPYVVMQYLGGGSLKSRLESGPGGAPVPMPLESLRTWLLNVAEALDFVHGESCIHRDVKPANILFDRHGHAFLGDFGIIKFLTTTEQMKAASSQTAPGILLGTPSYVAPEVVMGHDGDGRVDQYALAMSVHEVLTGKNFMAGPSPSATIVNQTKVEAPALSEILPGIPLRLSFAVLRALSKDPRDRYDTCVAFANEVLADIPSSQSPPKTDSGLRFGQIVEPARTERLSCPSCAEPQDVGIEHEGELVRCPRCHMSSTVEVDGGTARLVPTASEEPSWSRQVPLSAKTAVETKNGKKSTYRRLASATASPNDRTMIGPLSLLEGSPKPAFQTLSPRQWLATGLAVIAAALAMAFFLNRSTVSERKTHFILTAEPPADTTIEINIAYGTEKKKWLEQAREEFRQTERGKGIKINLLGKGSIEGAKLILDGEKPTPIHVWSPASRAYSNVFVEEWRRKHGTHPFTEEQNLALTPMVFVMWKDKYEAFLKHYKKVSFGTIAQAMKAEDRWGSEVEHPDWSYFKFSHTNPIESNSGMLCLVLMAYEHARKERRLSLSDVKDTSFQKFLEEFERGLSRPGGKLEHSTGTLMRNMAFFGPSQFDCILVYENLPIDHLQEAKDRWHRDLRVVYPEPNMWNEHPYYILNVPWSSAAQREAASVFLKFLMTEKMQLEAMKHGFRPGNPSVLLTKEYSSLLKVPELGVHVEVDRVAEPPRAEVLESLFKQYEHLEF